MTSAWVRVEEYKRPTFTVTMQPVQDPLCYGDVVRQEGLLKSYAGFSVAGGEVWYRITRTTYSRPHGRYMGRVTLNEGTVVSDAAGRFDIVFPAERPEFEDCEGLDPAVGHDAHEGRHEQGDDALHGKEPFDVRSETDVAQIASQRREIGSPDGKFQEVHQDQPELDIR